MVVAGQAKLRVRKNATLRKRKGRKCLGGGKNTYIDLHIVQTFSSKLGGLSLNLIESHQDLHFYFIEC